jgi:hypothetical protein
MANSWEAEDARKLAEYASDVLADKAYRTKGQRWRPDIITR